MAEANVRRCGKGNPEPRYQRAAQKNRPGDPLPAGFIIFIDRPAGGRACRPQRPVVAKASRLLGPWIAKQPYN
jgi:hypothetical protein